MNDLRTFMFYGSLILIPMGAAIATLLWWGLYNGNYFPCVATMILTVIAVELLVKIAEKRGLVNHE